MPSDLDATAASVLSWLLTYAIHSSILLSGAAVAAWRCADHHAWLDPIWKAAVIAPLLTASLHFDPMVLPLGGRWAISDVSRLREDASARQASPTTLANRAPLPIDDTSAARPTSTDRASAPGLDRIEGNDATAPVTEAPPSPLGGFGATGRSTWRAEAVRWPLIAAITWLILASVAVLRYAVRLRRVYRALGAGAPVTAGPLVDCLDSLRTSAGERRAIRLTTSSLCPVPLALGGGHIVVPPRFLEELDAEQQRAALAHELGHVVRRDPEWRIAVEVLERALLFQPLNRVARARLCDAAEFLCDEWAVRHTQSPLALARCLSIVASWWSATDVLPAGASAMARSDSAMVKRVISHSRRARTCHAAARVLVGDSRGGGRRRRAARDGNAAAGAGGGDAGRGRRPQRGEDRDGRRTARAGTRVDHHRDREGPGRAARPSVRSTWHLARGALAPGVGGRRPPASRRLLARLHLQRRRRTQTT